MIDSFSIVKISDYSYSADFSVFDSKEIDNEALKLGLKLGIKLNTLSNSLLQVLINVVIWDESDVNKTNLVDYVSETRFKISNARMFEKFENLNYSSIPKKYLRLVLNSSIGNCRGMLYNKLANTPVDLIVPLINTEAIVESMKNEK